MTIANEKREVQRDVAVVRCDRPGCTAEVLEEASTGWMHCCILEVVERQTGPLGLGPLQRVVSQREKSERHLCPSCTELVVKVLNEPAGSRSSPRRTRP